MSLTSPAIPRSSDVPDDQDKEEESGLGHPVATEANDDIILFDGTKVPQDLLKRATMFSHKQAYNLDGEISFRLKPLKEEVVPDHYQPLGFLRALGYQRNQAKKLLKDPKFYTNISICLKEARLWTLKIDHSQASLLFEASVKITRGKRAAEYVALATDAILSGNFVDYDELMTFIKVITLIEDEKLSWENLIPPQTRKNQTNIPHMLYRFGVEKIFDDTLKLAKQLMEKDEALMGPIIQNVQHNSADVAGPSNLEAMENICCPKDKYHRKGLTGDADDKHSVKFVDDRKPISDKELAKQCCIFANYYDHSMYYYQPLVAHMIARGYFTTYLQIEAVCDFLRPICGMRPVKLVELLNLIDKVSSWTNYRDNSGELLPPSSHF